MQIHLSFVQFKNSLWLFAFYNKNSCLKGNFMNYKLCSQNCQPGLVSIITSHYSHKLFIIRTILFNRIMLYLFFPLVNYFVHFSQRINSYRKTNIISTSRFPISYLQAVFSNVIRNDSRKA